MKRIVLIALMIFTLIVFSGCSATYQDNVDVNDNIQEKTVEYYPNSSVPKLDSLLDESEIIGKTEYPLYGPYTSTGEAKMVMTSYVAELKTNYGFTVTDESVGYTLSNGKDEVVIMGGNTEGKFAVAVVVN